MTDTTVTFFHSPNTRSFGTLILLDELGASYRLHVPALTWTTGFGICPKTPAIEAYLERWNARPSVARAKVNDAELAASQATCWSRPPSSRSCIT